MSLQTRHLFEFEDYRLDPSEKVLTRAGLKIPLTPKVFETLQVLVENAGQLVEKDELMQQIWQDRFVEENNLTFNVKMLRKALGDAAAHPRFIETVPRRGYRFIAETRLIQAEANEGGPPAMPHAVAVLPSQITFLRRYRLPFVFAAVLAMLVFGAAASWYLTIPSEGEEHLAPIFSLPRRSEALSYSGNLYFPRISPDGKYITYATHEGENRHIWLRELSTGNHFPLLSSTTEDYIGLMFSSGSDFVYFARKPIGGSQAEGSIYRISIFGGIPTRIVSDIQGWFSLSPVNDQIAFVRYDADSRSELWIADSDGQGSRRIAFRDTPHSFRANRWSPDGQAVTVAVGQGDSGANDIGLVEINIDSGEEREVTSKKFLYIDDLEWLPQRAGLLFVARESTTPNSQIWRVSPADGEVVKVVHDGAAYSSLSLDRSAKQMAVTQVVPDFRLNIANFIDRHRSTSTAMAPTVSTFTPSGKIVYAAFKGQIDLWMMNADGSDQRQLTNNPFEDIYPLLSRDEKHIFFASGQPEGRQIWRMNADGSDQIQITKKVGGYPIFVSPDGKTLYYMSAVGRDLWKVPCDGGEESLFFKGGLMSPAFSSDGKYFAYFRRNQTVGVSYSIRVVSTADLTESFSFEPVHESAGPIQISWAPDGRSFYYASKFQSTTTVWRQSLTSASPEKITEIGNGQSVIDFAVAPDGQTFSYVSGTWRREARLVKGL